MKIITKNDENEIIKLSKIFKQSEIKEKLNIPIKEIRRILKENNISTSKSRLNLSRLKFNFNYFDEIDCPKKAYWLGFLAADGCLKNNKVRLTSADLEIIEKFKRDLESEHKITKTEVLDKRTNKIYTGYHIQITSKAFTDKLSKWIPINKSENFNLPKIDEKYLSFFLAGLLDGDGCIWYDNGNLRFNFLSTKECLLDIQLLLINKFDIKKIKLNYKINNLWGLNIMTKSYDILNYIYDEKYKEIYLSRKYNKYKNYIDKDRNRFYGLRPIIVFNEKNEILYEFKSITECMDILKICPNTLFKKLKDGEFYKNMKFISLEKNKKS